MVRMIENWVKIKGNIKKIESSGMDEEFDSVIIQLTDIENYSSYPNLLSDLKGTRVCVNVTHSIVDSLKLLPGKVITGLLRSVGNQQFFLAENSIQTD